MAKILKLSVWKNQHRFLEAYRRADGDPSKLSKQMVDLRRRAINRLVKVSQLEDDPMWRHGVPTRRHVAMICWGYSPTPSRVANFKYATAA